MTIFVLHWKEIDISKSNHKLKPWNCPSKLRSSFLLVLQVWSKTGMSSMEEQVPTVYKISFKLKTL